MTIWNKITGAFAAVTRGERFASFLRGESGTDRSDIRSGIAFTIAVIALSAKMAKSDGIVTCDEFGAFKRVVRVPSSEERNVNRLFDLAKQDIAGFETYARQIGAMLADETQLRRDVLEGLFVIAAADGILHEREETYLRTVAGHLGIPETEFRYIRSLFVHDTGNPYAVLGLQPSATGKELKAAHRRLVLENHPDRLTGRGVPHEFIVIAERKLAAINAAFDAIAGERGL